MRVKVEWVTGILRACESDEENSPYNLAMTVVRDGTVAHLKGAAGQYSRATFKKICETLKAQGITTLVWERKNNKARDIRKII